MAELRAHFRPELLNRVDDIVLFKPLQREELKRIVELQVDDLRCRLADRQIYLEMSPEAVGMIVDRGYDPLFGARPLRRFIQHEVETRIARALLSGDVNSGSTIELTVAGGNLTVTWRVGDCGCSRRGRVCRVSERGVPPCGPLLIRQSDDQTRTRTDGLL